MRFDVYFGSEADISAMSEMGGKPTLIHWRRAAAHFDDLTICPIREVGMGSADFYPF